jgi:hypothetical protein
MIKLPQIAPGLISLLKKSEQKTNSKKRIGRG